MMFVYICTYVELFFLASIVTYRINIHLVHNSTGTG